MVKMIMSLPYKLNADEFVELATTVVLGRYGKKGFYDGLAAPRVEWLKMGNKDATAYAIDAEEIDPAFISAVEYLGKFVPVNFYFVNGDTVLDKDYFKPSSTYFEKDGRYTNDTAEDACEEFMEKLEFQKNRKQYKEKRA
ncbi:MAG: hypothetical protein IJU91_00920 [Selenomonadaceae bacterium]|nr:hypothetical protein [Selenomonadaceae bacterium]